MKTILLLPLLLILAIQPADSQKAPLPDPLLPIAQLDAGGGFGGKRILKKRNRRTRRINRKNGVGFLPSPPKSWGWMLPDFNQQPHTL